MAKVGDFGLAVVTYPDDNDNPLAFRRSGTRGYLAPVSSYHLSANSH